MANVVISTSPIRAAYNRVRRLMTAENAGTEFIINQKTLRIEQLLTASKNQYTFDLYENRGSDRELEIKLNRNDLFFLTHIGLCLTKQDATTTPAKYGNYPLFTHPDPNYFLGDDSTNPTENLALECVYNGRLTIKTEPVERLVDYHTQMFRYVPERNYTIAAGSQTDDEFPQWGPDIESRGFVELHPNIILDGQENNEVRLTLGSGNTELIAGAVNGSGSAVDTRNVAVLLLHGFVVVNGAQKVGRWTAN